MILRPTRRSGGRLSVIQLISRMSSNRSSTAPWNSPVSLRPATRAGPHIIHNGRTARWPRTGDRNGACRLHRSVSNLIADSAREMVSCPSRYGACVSSRSAFAALSDQPAAEAVLVAYERLRQPRAEMISDAAAKTNQAKAGKAPGRRHSFTGAALATGCRSGRAASGLPGGRAASPACCRPRPC